MAKWTICPPAAAGIGAVLVFWAGPDAVPGSPGAFIVRRVRAVAA